MFPTLNYRLMSNCFVYLTMHWRPFRPFSTPVRSKAPKCWMSFVHDVEAGAGRVQLFVEVESVGADQGKTLEIRPVRDVAQQSERVS